MAKLDLPSTTAVELEFNDGWLHLWFNRPDNRNALSTELVADLLAAFAAVHDNRDVRGIFLRGRNDMFCAGADLKGFKRDNHDGDSSVEAVADSNYQSGSIFRTVATAPQVVVALVDGFAIAGGMGLACAADITIVTEGAQFSLTETAIGIVPAQISPYVIARLGQSNARLLMLSGARFKGNDALKYGLAHQVVADAEALTEAGDAIRKQVRKCAPGANAATKRVIQAFSTLDADALSRFSANEFAHCMMDEGKEGVASFLEKRKPRWNQ